MGTLVVIALSSTVIFLFLNFILKVYDRNGDNFIKLQSILKLKSNNFNPIQAEMFNRTSY